MVFNRPLLAGSLVAASLMVASRGFAQGGTPQGAVRAAERQCRLHEAARRILEARDGRVLYVEPSALASNGRAVLIAGQPTMVWRPSAGRRWVLEQGSDSVFGVIVAPGARYARIVPMPPGIVDTVAGVRAVANRDGSWTVVWVEADSVSRSGAAEVRRVRAGTFDGRRWLARVDSLPIPSDVAEFRYAETSDPVIAGDSIVWGVPVSLRDGPSRGLVYVRHRDRWSVEYLPTSAIVAVVPAWSPASGLVAAVIRGDTTERGDRNSLFLFRHDPVWRLSQRISRGAVEGAYSAQWATGRGGLVLGWSQAGHVLSAAYLRDSMTSPRRHFEERMSEPALATGPGSLVLWLTQHRIARQFESRLTAMDDSRIIPLRTYTHGGRNILHRLAHVPAARGRELLLIGIGADSLADGERVYTRLVEARIDCDSTAR